MVLDLDAVGKPTEVFTFEYDWKDVVLYALGIGARAAELDYLYDVRGPKVYPTFAVVPAFPVNLAALQSVGGNLLAIVHGGQRIVLHAPIPPCGTLRTTGAVAGIYDRVRMGQVVVETKTTDVEGKLLFETTWSILYRGEGGIGPKPPKRPGDDVKPPSRPPDFTHEEKTSETQALLYRLNGDINPLHADPQLSQMAGFGETPILHGLCTVGHAARAVILNACGGDGDGLRILDAQFRKPVWPGDTLVTEGWKEGGRVVFAVKTKERGEPVITNAIAEVAEF